MKKNSLTPKKCVKVEKVSELWGITVSFQKVSFTLSSSFWRSASVAAVASTSLPPGKLTFVCFDENKKF
jgi:hypothetical protein